MAASVLQFIDPSAVSAAARRESRSRPLHLPPVSAYRWWARRTRAVTAALLDAAQHHLGRPRLTVLDPFSGGGVIPFVALAAGHRVLAADLDPWAVWGLQTALGLPPPADLLARHQQLRRAARVLLSAAYRTTTPAGAPAWIAHTLRVAVAPCTRCGEVAALFPLALVSLTRRRDQEAPPAGWLACPAGHLFHAPVLACSCPVCRAPVDPEARYLPRRQVTCTACGRQESLSARAQAGGRGGWSWAPALVERVADGQRLPLDRPTPAEVRQADGPRWQTPGSLGPIPDTAESRVLLRHGFRCWEDLYPTRQRRVLSDLLALAGDDPAARAALLGTAEMAGLLSRWDRFYLKGTEAMAGHRFNFTTLPVEPNVWGLAAAGRGTASRRFLALQKAAGWLHGLSTPPEATIVRADARRLPFPDAAADLILTDPPYHDDVRYDELSAPLRAWAGLGDSAPAGDMLELTGDYEAALTAVFRELRRVLHPRGRLVFTYANRDPAAWEALLGALEAAGFRAAGIATLHSENEQDAVKRDVRAHTLDLVLDLVLVGHPDAEAGFQAPEVYGSAEECFLRCAGAAALALGRDGRGGWRSVLRQALGQSLFTA